MRSTINGNAADYACYPSVRQFGSHFGVEHLQRCIRQSNAEPVPCDLAVHVQGATAQDDECDHHVALLIKEAATMGALFDADRCVEQVAIDENVTRTANEACLRKLMTGLHEAFHFSKSAAVQFAVDSRHVGHAEIAAMVSLGATRIGVGIHECDGQGLAASAVQTVEGAWRTIGYCVKHPGVALDLDLFIGCTGQTHASFSTTLELAIANRPARIALPSCWCSAEQTLGESWRELAIERLVFEGYVYLGLGQLVASEDALAHARSANKLRRTLLGFTAGAHCDVIGLGPGAISRIGDSLSQNATELSSWTRAVHASELAVTRGRLLDYDDIVRGAVIDELMCRGSVEIPTVERRFALDFPTYFADALARLAALEDHGIVARDPTRIAATSRGRGQLRMIAACFDRYHDTNTR